MPGLVLVAVQDLRLGLDLELAQLLLQARHRARQLAQIEFDRAELLLQPRARDADLAGVVEQLIEQLGADARHLDAIGGDHRLASRRQRRRGAAGTSGRIGRQRCSTAPRVRCRRRGRTRGDAAAAAALRSALAAAGLRRLRWAARQAGAGAGGAGGGSRRAASATGAVGAALGCTPHRVAAPPAHAH